MKANVLVSHLPAATTFISLAICFISGGYMGILNATTYTYFDEYASVIIIIIIIIIYLLNYFVALQHRSYRLAN